MQIPVRKESRALQAALAAIIRKASQCAGLIALTGLALSALGWVSAGTRAQTPNTGYPLSVSEQQALRATLNNSSLFLAASHPDASYFAMAHDMAAAIGKTAEVRLVPMITGGGVENLRDLIYLRGVDLAIVPANVLAQAKSMEGLLGGGLPQRVAYVAHLYADEVHLLAGSSVATIEGLRGARIGVPLDDGTAEFTARDLLARLGIQAEIVRLRPAAALEQVRSGDLAAALLVGGKPLQFVSSLPKDGRLRLLGLPFAKPMEQSYLPAAFRADDYPGVIPPGVTVETVAVSAVLMASTARGNDEAGRRIARFVPLFFAGIADLTPVGRSSKWLELNLATPLPGWTRVPAAAEWLQNAKEQQRAFLQKGFDEFLRTVRQPGAPELTPAERRKLFDNFVEWTRQSVVTTEEPARP